VKHPRAARAALDLVAKALDIPVSVRLWDGSLVPLGRAADSPLHLSVGGPGVAGALLRRPTLENLLRQYAAGGIDFHGGDLMEFAGIARPKGFRERFRTLPKWRLARHLLAFLFARSDPPQGQHAFP